MLKIVVIVRGIGNIDCKILRILSKNFLVIFFESIVWGDGFVDFGDGDIF